PVFLAAQRRRRLDRELVRLRKEDFGAEGLEQRPPALAGERLLERGDALGGDDRDAAGLARHAEEFFVAVRVVPAHGGEILVLVTDEEGIAVRALPLPLHRR